MDASLSLSLFGPFRVLVGGEPMPHVRSRKALWLLALLALRNGRPAAREWVAGTLWPDADGGVALANLRPVVSELRRALGSQGDRIGSPDRGSIVLVLENATVDVLAFDAAFRSGDLAQAAELYVGNLLEGCPEEWAIQERNAREEACLQALQGLGEAALSSGEEEAARAHFQRAIALGPLRDAPHRGLMETLAASGEVNAALQVYRDFAHRLSAEMGTAPDRELAALYERLRAGLRQPSKAARPPTASLRVAPPRATPHNLPAPLTELIGREDERLDVAARLRRARLVTLTGLGGIGKTRLAQAVAADLLGEFPHGVWFVPLEALSDERAIERAVAVALGLREEPARPLLPSLVEGLRERRSLLVIDNCEHLLGGVARLAVGLLRGCPELRILATSREPVGVAGEATWPVLALAYPDAASLPAGRTTRLRVVGGYESVRLFVERAQAAQPEFSLGEGNLAAVVEICARLEGMPLALELAAARVRGFPIDALAERLRGKLLDTLQGRGPSVAGRQTTLRGTLDWSFDLLNPEERGALAYASTFVGGFPREAAEAVIGPEAIERLASLADRSLVGVDVGKGRYSLLETVREYASERLDASGERSAAESRRRVWCADLGRRAEGGLLGSEQLAWLETLDAEWPNLRATLAQDDEPDLALVLATSLWRYWYTRSMREGREWLARCLDRCPNAPTRMRSAALYALGCLAFNESDFGEARRLLEQSLGLREKDAEPKDLARTLGALGNCAAAVDDYARAAEYCERSIAILREEGDLAGATQTTKMLATVFFCLADYDRTRRLNEETEAFYREAGNLSGVLWSLHGQASVDERQGDYATARVRLEEALGIARQVGDRQGVAWCLCTLGTVFRHDGQGERAEETLRASLAEFGECGHRRAAACCATALGQALLDRGDAVGARRLQEEALRDLRESGDRVSTAESLHALGNTLAALGDSGGAENRWCESLRIRAGVGERKGIADGIDSLAQRAVDRSDDALAALLFGATEALRERLGAPIPPPDRSVYERARDLCRSRLGDGAFDARRGEGRALSESEAVAYALSGS